MIGKVVFLSVPQLGTNIADFVRSHCILRNLLLCDLRLGAWGADVNTASMLWPNGQETLLVDGDHGDIIGHYVLDPPQARPRSTRHRGHDSYDLLRSGSDFGESLFRRIWDKVFGFSA